VGGSVESDKGSRDNKKELGGVFTRLINPSSCPLRICAVTGGLTLAMVGEIEGT